MYIDHVDDDDVADEKEEVDVDTDDDDAEGMVGVE